MDGNLERVLVDTSVIIDYFRKTQKATAWFTKLAATHRLAISNVTKFELDIGVSQKSAFLEAIYSKIEVLELNIACTDLAAEFYRELKTKNQLIALPDLLIAATAVAHQLPLATLNLKHFQRIPRLTCLSPQ